MQRLLSAYTGAREQLFIVPALNEAASGGYAEIARLLLSLVTNIRVKNAHCWSSLLLAAEYGHADIASLMLECLDASADSGTEKRILGQAALRIARKGRAEIVRLLLAAGVDINAKDKNGNTALMLAKKAGYIEIANMLRAAGARGGKST